MTVNETIAKYNETNDDLNYETTELLECPQEVYDAAHLAADSSADVIYYGKAHQLVDAAARSEVNQAEQTIEDCGGYGSEVSYDKIATIIAYWIIHQRYVDLVTDELESFRNWMEENEIESDEMTEAIETILN